MRRVHASLVRAVGVLLAAGVSAVFAAIPEDTVPVGEVREAYSVRDKLEREYAGRNVVEEVAKAREARNAELRQIMSRPPLEFEHYRNPPAQKAAAAEGEAERQGDSGAGTAWWWLAGLAAVGFAVLLLGMVGRRHAGEPTGNAA